MHSVGRALYNTLRGGAAVIEGAEFLLTHRRILGEVLPDLLTASLCTIIGLSLGAWAANALPTTSPVTLPWFLVLVEWIWFNLSSLLAAELGAWVAQTAYAVVVPPRRLVLAVLRQRGTTLPASSTTAKPRRLALGWLLAGGAGCALAAQIPVGGPLVATVLAFPVLGGGLFATTVGLLAWPRKAALSFLWNHRGASFGLGIALIVCLAIPLVNLLVLPCAVAGATCLVVREKPDAWWSEPPRK